MRKINLAIITAASCATLFSACSKVGPMGATGPAGPTYTGAISGHVFLYDQYGSRVFTNLNSVQLSLNGGSSRTADTTGFYKFDTVTTGSYNMTAIASGYASTRANNFQFLSDTLNKDIKLSAIPSFAPTAFAAYQGTLIPGDSLVINFDADTRARNCIVFLNKTSTVNNSTSNYLVYYTKAIAVNQTKATIIVPAQDLYDAGLASGSTAYYAAYGYVTGDVSAYEDLTTGKTQINAVSTTSLTASAATP